MSSVYIPIPAMGSPQWKPSVANLAALPATGNSSGDARVTRDTAAIHIWNGSAWVIPTAGGVAWGSITGTLSNQTDLQSALNAKQSTSLVDGTVWIGSGSNVATANHITGDASINNTGAVHVSAAGNGAITFGVGGDVNANSFFGDGSGLTDVAPPTLTDAHIFVGVSGVATDVAMTGDVGIDDTGATLISSIAGAPVSYDGSSYLDITVGSGINATNFIDGLGNNLTDTTNTAFGALAAANDAASAASNAESTAETAFSLANTITDGTNIYYPGSGGATLADSGSLYYAGHSALTDSSGNLHSSEGTVIVNPSGTEWYIGTTGGVVKIYNSDTTEGNGVSSVVKRFLLAAQTTSISPTTLFTPRSGGDYTVKVYLVTTTAGTSGTVTCTIGWNDGIAARTVTSPTVTFGSLAAPVQIVQFIGNIDTASDITYATTVTSAVGSPQYQLVMVVERQN